MSLSVALQLGRVSNLPTVWTNALAGIVLAGGQPWTASALLAGIGLSLLYVSGMYLNDAFDRDIDAKDRPSRPIPCVSARLMSESLTAPIPCVGCDVMFDTLTSP